MPHHPQAATPRAFAFDYNQVSARSEYHFTERLAIRPLMVSDTWTTWSACQDPDFNKNLLWEAPQSPEEMLERVEAIQSEVRLNRMTALSIVLRESGEWIGLVRYFPSMVSEAPNAIEGGIWLHPKFWASGLSLEIAAVVANACFIEDPSLQTIVVRVSKANRSANRLMASLGFEVIGEGLATREDGTPMHILHHAISRSKWETIPRQNQVLRAPSPV